MRLIKAAGAALLIPGLAVTGLTGSANAAPSPHGRISTVIGGPGGPAPATSVSIDPCTLKVVGAELYFSNGQAGVDRVSQRTGLLTAIAGNGASPFGQPGPADGTPAAAATLSSACGVTADGAGNVLVADGAQVLVVAAKTGTFYRKKMTVGRVYTVASGFSASGEGEADSGGAVDVQLDAAGNLVITVAGTQASHTNPEGDSRVFVYAEHAGTFYGKKMAKGWLYQIGGSLTGYTLGNAVPATHADLGYSIGTVRVDSAGNLIVADTGGLFGGGPDTTGPPVPAQVRVIANRTGTFYGQHMKAGYIYTIAGGGTSLANGVAATDASLRAAAAVAIDHAGNVLIADETVRVIAAKTGSFYGQRMTAGHIYTLPGFTNASQDALGVAVDNAGNVLVASSASRDVRMLAAKPGSYYGKHVKAGHVVAIAGNGRLRYSGDGGPATRAELAPSAVATLRSGAMTAVADAYSSSVVRVVPGRTGVFFGQSMRAGFIYTVAGTGVASFSGGDGGLGTRTALGQPDAVAFDSAGNLLISDRFTHLVRIVACTTGRFYGQKMTAGHIYTVAGGGTEGPESGIPARDEKFEGPLAVASDPAGDAAIIDSSGAGTASQVWLLAAKTGTRYGQAMTAGDIYLVAGDGNFGLTGDGGPATAAEIESQDVAVDGNGNLVLADESRVRVVAGKAGTFYGQHMAVGDIYTVAGGGTQNAADGTPALKAKFGFGILQVAVDPAGNLLAGGYSTVFMVAERVGSYYGKAMHAGDVYTVARANRFSGLLGDGGPAIGALFDAIGIAVAAGTGNLLIADDFTDRVRSVSR